MIKFAGSELPVGCVRRKRLEPQETVDDVVVFESPSVVTVLTRLELDLPLGAARFLFTIPGTIIRKPPPQVIGMVPVALAPRESESPPRRQPTLEEQILADYERRWAEVARRQE